MFLIYQVSRINRDYVLHYNSINLFLIIAVMFREGQARSPTKSEWDSANAKPYKHTDDCSTKSDWDSAENLIDGADGVQSLRLDGRKVCNIKRVGISQAESNKTTVCALPSIHLPLTREASVIVLLEG